VPPPQKTGQKQRRARGLSRSRDQTSAQELALAKALKQSKKPISGSSGLNPAEKASTAKGGIREGKKPLPHTAPKALYLFGSASSSSKDEAAAPAPTPTPCQKRPRRSPPKFSQKSSNAPPVKGMFIGRWSIHLFYVCYI
jgi:hypothetical protein